ERERESARRGERNQFGLPAEEEKECRYLFSVARGGRGCCYQHPPPPKEQVRSRTESESGRRQLETNKGQRNTVAAQVQDAASRVPGALHRGSYTQPP
uniref:Uncharacterized protein n=1 Tax=Anopheles albimanus TaxID=7167 RepID=A0A182FZ88_ANOAL